MGKRGRDRDRNWEREKGKGKERKWKRERGRNRQCWNVKTWLHLNYWLQSWEIKPMPDNSPQSNIFFF